MKYIDLFNAQTALVTLGTVRKNRIALRARRIIRIVNDELENFLEIVKERGGKDIKEDELNVLGNELASTEEVDDFDLGRPVKWGALPPDSLTAFEIAALEEIGALVGVPEDDDTDEA